MMIIRPVSLTDLPAICELASECGVGITTLPNNEQLLTRRIQKSIAALATDISTAGSEYYFFVLEDTTHKKVIGCSAIKAAAGLNYPLYSYKVATITRISKTLDLRKDLQLLHLVNDLQGKTEICTLYLSPAYRQAGNGVLLSRSRFLFMGQHPQRFTDTVFAEMRGISDQQGQSPFWDSLGKHFFDMEFPQADHLSAITDKQFIADLMPREPIYICLLSQEAQQVIGKPHDSTKPAMKILQKQGFSYDNYIDIFDAGPTLISPLKQIKTIKKTRQVYIKSISNKPAGKRYIIAAATEPFRACLTNIECRDDDNEIMLSPSLAEALQLEVGDPVSISPLQI